MEPPTYQRRYEELQRIRSRLKALKSQIINGKGEDSFGSPKDIALSLFRVNYELKETLKKEDSIPREVRDKVERYCLSHEDLALVLDIANAKKHLKSDKPRLRKTTKTIGEINTHLAISTTAFPPAATTVTIMVDGVQLDCLVLCEKTMESWRQFFHTHNIPPYAK